MIHHATLRALNGALKLDPLAFYLIPTSQGGDGTKEGGLRCFRLARDARIGDQTDGRVFVLPTAGKILHLDDAHTKHDTVDLLHDVTDDEIRAMAERLMNPEHAQQTLNAAFARRSELKELVAAGAPGEDIY